MHAACPAAGLSCSASLFAAHWSGPWARAGPQRPALETMHALWEQRGRCAVSPTLFSYAPGHASCAAHHRLCSTGCLFPPPAWALTWQEASAVRMLARPAQFCAASGSASLLPLPSSSRASVGLGVSTLMGTKRVAGATESVVYSAACRACTPWLVMKRVAARRHKECCLFKMLT